VKACVLALISFWMVLGNASAQTESGSTANYLADSCKDWDTTKAGSYDSGYCLGFIKGVDSEIDVCERKNVTVGQVVKVALKYMDDHPEELDQPASTVVRRALEKAFPCSK
jgi:hypothetical protein